MAEKPRTAKGINELEARLRALGISRPARAVHRLLVTLAKPPAHARQVRDLDHEAIASLTVGWDADGEVVRDRLVVIGYAYPTVGWLAEAVQYSERTVYGALAELEAARLLYRRRLRNGNRYFMLLPIDATAAMLDEPAADHVATTADSAGSAPAADTPATAAVRPAESAVAYMVSESESRIRKLEVESSLAHTPPQFSSQTQIPAISLEASELVTEAHRTLCRERELDLNRCASEFLGRKRNQKKRLRLEQYRGDFTDWLLREKKPQNRLERSTRARGNGPDVEVTEWWALGRDVFALGGSNLAASVRPVESQPTPAAPEPSAAERAALAAAVLEQQREREAAEAEHQAQRAATAQRHGALTRLAARIIRRVADATDREQFAALLAELPDTEREKWRAVAMPVAA